VRKPKDESTKATILDAAKEVFMQKGYTGTRTQEIADKAGINKAMLHYYYGNKEKLFRVILTEAIQLIAPMIIRSLSSDKDVRGKLEDLVTNHIAILLDRPHLPMFVMHELSQNQGKFITEMVAGEQIQPVMLGFFQQVVEEGEAGIIRKVNPIHLLINVMSMTVFPFVMRPIISSIAQLPVIGYRTVLEERAAQTIEFVHAALRP
jgi:AcrR family transcriptional regulator